jgi:pimeloyl-ACP methyl ester carboxylesterase
LKKSKVPPLLRFIQWLFPKLEKFSPWLADKLFIKIFFTPLRYPLPEKEKLLQEEAIQSRINIEGKRIAVYEWGKGPMVLLVHGWAGRATQFRKIIEALVTEGYRVIGFDGPAHGNSQGKSTNILEFEDVLRKVFSTFGTPVGVIAHSFGGGAVLFAAINGLPVEKLITIASPSIGDEIIATYLRTIKGSWKTGEAFKSYIERKYGKPFDHFTSSHFIGMIKHKIQLMIIQDHDDEDVPLKHAHHLVKLYPQAKLVETKGLGHTRILKDDFVIEQCVTFMRQNRLN